MTGKIIVIGGIYVIAGVALYLYLKRNTTSASKPGTMGNEVMPSAPAVSGATNTMDIGNVSYTNNYCNPPISPTDPQRELRKFYYRKQIAEDAWNAQGRGMSLDFFMKEYNKQQGC